MNRKSINRSVTTQNSTPIFCLNYHNEVRRNLLSLTDYNTVGATSPTRWLGLSHTMQLEHCVNYLNHFGKCFSKTRSYYRVKSEFSLASATGF